MFLKRISSDLNKLLVDSWSHLVSIEDLDVVEKSSFDRPVVIFKHSTRCGLSASAKYRLEQKWPGIDKEVNFYYLDLIAFRGVSNKISERWDVVHQSPQIILLHEGEVIFHTSHHGISVDAIKSNLPTRTN